MDEKDIYEDIYSYDIEDKTRYCGAKNSMIYAGDICFVCDKCGNSVHEDIYYRWIAGDEIKFED